MTTGDSSIPPKKRGRPSGRPATTPEEREKQLQSKAYDLAEKQLESGKASSQLITTLIKGGGVREQLERERLENENKLLLAKVESMATAIRIESLLEEAMEAFRTYDGSSKDEHDD